MTQTAPGVIHELVDHFERDLDRFKASEYKEAHVRQEFLNPFWEALGWDMTNRNRLAEAYKEVIHEDSISIEGRIKAPDYVFRVGSEKKFFLEAKAPKIHVRTEVQPAYQLKRYAWSAGLPISLLSDFEEFAVYQCTSVPKPNDPATKDRVEFFTFREYVERWPWIHENFSREAVWQGRFDKFVDQNKGKRGQTPFDKKFLADMMEWRVELAKNIALRNPSISERELNFAVQVTLDRIIMLRISEDRGIEQYGNLAFDAGVGEVVGQKRMKSENVYKKFIERFKAADDRYNSGLFHFHKEKDRGAADELTPRLAIDDKILHTIVKQLYYPESPYAFDVVPSDILGHIYEQFLGQVITLTSGHKAKIEEKPEVKKAGGVYYTPTYIVDYIVKNTVGKFLADFHSGSSGSGEESGSGVRGPGSGGEEEFYPGSREENKENDKELQGSGRVERGDGVGGYDVRSARSITASGEVRATSADAAGSDLDSLQHSGRSWTETPEGVRASRIDSVRFADGTGDADVTGGATEIRSTSADRGLLEARSENRPNAEPTSQRTRGPASPRNQGIGSRGPGSGVRIPELTILDPACGSGSFLLGAYQYLLDWYLKYYLEDADYWYKRKALDKLPTRSPMSPRTPGPGPRTPLDSRTQNEQSSVSPENYRLSLNERKRILTDHIFGVDIDRNAVEVAKLNLMLKVLEGTKESTEKSEYRIAYDTNERLLPDLDKNIICGNSLIGWDYFTAPSPSPSKKSPAPSREVGIDINKSPSPSGEGWGEERRGNVTSQTPMSPTDDEIARINPLDWKQAFPSIMKKGGFDVVIGNPPYVFGRDWKELGIGEEHKEYFSRHYTASPYQLDMFSLFMERVASLTKVGGFTGQIVPNVWLTNTFSSITRKFVFQEFGELSLALPPSTVFEGVTVDTIVYCGRRATDSEAFIHVSYLSKTGEILREPLARSPYTSGEQPLSLRLDSRTSRLIERIRAGKPELGLLAELTRGVHPYRIGGYGKSAFGEGAQTAQDIEKRPYHSSAQRKGFRPFIYGKDLKRFCSPVFKEYVSYGPHLAEPRNPSFFEGERVYSRKILGDRLVVTVVEDDSVADQQVYITKPLKSAPSAFVLAAIMGSRLMSFYIKNYYDELDEAFPQVKVGQLRELPIAVPPIGVAGELEEAIKQLFRLCSKEETEATQRMRIHFENGIDLLIYLLYGLTEEEIRIVEGEG